MLICELERLSFLYLNSMAGLIGYYGFMQFYNGDEKLGEFWCIENDGHVMECFNYINLNREVDIYLLAQSTISSTLTSTNVTHVTPQLLSNAEGSHTDDNDSKCESMYNPDDDDDDDNDDKLFNTNIDVDVEYFWCSTSRTCSTN